MAGRSKTTETPVLTPIEAKSVLHKILYGNYCELYKKWEELIHYDKIYCPICGEFLTKKSFYPSNKHKSGVQPICIKCSTMIVEQREDKSVPSKETPETVRAMLQIYDLPYIDELYKQCVYDSLNSEKNIMSPFNIMMKTLTTNSKYRILTYKDSMYPKTSSNELAKSQPDYKNIIDTAKKRFGLGYSDEDYVMLETEYQDWISRYECDTKTQEKIFERLSFNNLAFHKANKSGASTKDLDKTYQELLSSLDILPKQANSNGLNDSLTFGQMIEKWEKEKPVPEPEDEFKDVEGIGKYIRVWFKGYLAKAMGIKNGYTKEFDDYVKDYTVTKPTYDQEGEQDIYNEIFGNQED